MQLTPRQRFSLRLGVLATVNTGVWFLYVSAITSAKAGVAEDCAGYVAEDGSTASWRKSKAYERYFSIGALSRGSKVVSPSKDEVPPAGEVHKGYEN
jgi:hypothetical protein